MVGADEQPAVRYFNPLPALGGLLVLVGATFNLSTLLHTIWYGRIHPVHYVWLWVAKDQPMLPPSLPAIIAALSIMVLLVSGAYFWHRLRRRELAEQSLWAYWGWAFWPALLALPWLMHFVSLNNTINTVLHQFWVNTFGYEITLELWSSRWHLLGIYGCIILWGWAIGRFTERVRDLLPDHHLHLQPAGPTASNWWREWPFWVVVLLSLVLTAYHTQTQHRLWSNLMYGSPDIGYYTEMLLNVLRGRGLSCEAFGHHFFGEHFSPILYLLVPIFALYPHIQTLMFIGAFAVLSGSWAIYALLRGQGGSMFSAGMVAIAYLLYPSTSRIIYGSSYGFHEILLAIPLMLWSFHFYLRRRWGWMLLFMLLAMGVKEDVVVVYTVFWTYVFLRGRKWWALGLALFSAGWFYIVVQHIGPHFNHTGEYAKYYLWKNIGGTPLGIAQTLLKDPALVLGRLSSWPAVNFCLALLLPLAILPIRRAVVLVIVPTLVFINLMDTSDFASIRFWHQATVIPVLWLAAVLAMMVADEFRPLHVGRVAMVLSCSLMLHLLLGYSPFSNTGRDTAADLQRNALWHADRRKALQELHQLIPPTARVQATSRLMAHFIDNEQVYPLDKQPSPPADWVIIDLAEDIFGVQTPDELEQRARALDAGQQYHFVRQWNSILLFQLSETAATP
ncbi:MAG: hypothetical protein HJJLKODD_01773 [Phycisphaerae bacterium]|nr:hypothetical protein [Phycisphaerae bacterium]